MSEQIGVTDYGLLTTCYLLLTTCYLLLTAHCVLVHLTEVSLNGLHRRVVEGMRLELFEKLLARLERRAAIVSGEQ